MKSYDYNAVVYGSEVYCTDCLPDDVDVEDNDVSPIFANAEWDYVPICDRCGAEHDYVTVLSDNYNEYDEEYDDQPDEIDGFQVIG